MHWKWFADLRVPTNAQFYYCEFHSRLASTYFLIFYIILYYIILYYIILYYIILYYIILYYIILYYIILLASTCLGLTAIIMELAPIVLKTYSRKIVLQCFRISSVQRCQLP